MLYEKAKKHLVSLCVEITERCVGSSGNRDAAQYFARSMRQFGFAIEAPGFTCFDWTDKGASLHINGNIFDVRTSPYSLGCRIMAPLCLVSTVEELEAEDAAGKILLLKGEIAREQLMPKNFPFYNPEEHQKVISLLETRGIKAVVAATTRNPEMAGGVYPFPLVEDGDFTIPSVYMTAEEGERLAACAGQVVSLEIDAIRKPAAGCNVVATKGKNNGQRIVLCAHIDSKQGTAGAVDNATGITTLLLLGELLADYEAGPQVEIVALNGEDYYSNPGEVLYLEANRGKFSNIMLGINLDGVGYYRGNTAYSMYDCPAPIRDCVRGAFEAKEGIIEGEPWFQGDHGLFLMHARPALAVTSACMEELLLIAHTQRDTLDMVEGTKLVVLARALSRLIIGLSRQTA